MAKKAVIAPGIRNAAIIFARSLEQQGIPIAHMIVFGSHAKGTAREDSDIDLCVVSPKFGKDRVAELQFLLKQSRRIDDRIEPFPVSQEEYEKVLSPLVWEINKFGKKILLPAAA